MPATSVASASTPNRAPARNIPKTAAYLDTIQMVTGAVLILFMWSHLCLVSSVLLGASAMNGLAYFFEATYMAQIGGPIIGLIFLVHFVVAARKVPFRTSEQQLIWKHAHLVKHTDTWLWLVQAGSAMLILIMGGAHMWVVLTDLPITAAKSAARIQSWPWLLFYLALLPLVELHVGIGLYRIGVKWGFIKRANRKKSKKFENTLTLIFIGIGLLTLIRFLTLSIVI